MKKNIRVVRPGGEGYVLSEDGVKLSIPKGWAFLPAGDAGVTRKVTSSGECWRVQVQKGRRKISKGLFAPAETIRRAQVELAQLRSTREYQKKLESSRRLREKKQAEYSGEFFKTLTNYLSFASCYKTYETILARAVTNHAVPVGSGTVARTSMIPIEERAAKAVIAWMRHATTAYDSMKIPLIKGKRREVRRMLARASVAVLEVYRKGLPIPPECPLKPVLDKLIKGGRHV